MTVERRKATKISGLAAGLLASVVAVCGPAVAAISIEGQVEAGGGAVAGSVVTLWAATTDAPQRLAEVVSGADGSFVVSADQTPDGSTLYLIATGGAPVANPQGGANDAIAFLAALGAHPPAKVVVNEMTTIASVVTHAQVIDGAAIKGSPLALGIAAGNVQNFVDLATGAYGATIADALNGGQTPTLADFGTLANVLAGCATSVKADACAKVFTAATPPAGSAPTDTLATVESIVRYPSHEPEKLFALLDDFFPAPPTRPRPSPFQPSLTFAPSAWIFPLKFAGGGVRGPGKLMFDSEGNAWTANNFQDGGQSQDVRWDGGLSKFAPDGRPLSPAVTGFTGGGVFGPGFGLAVDAQDHVWATSFQGKTISVFDTTGTPLSPPDGYNINSQLGSMQGIIATPSGDIWALDTIKSQLVHFPKGDPAKAKLLCQSKSRNPDNPCKLFAPFALAIDQQDRIWVTSVFGDHVTRFPAADPTKAEILQGGLCGQRACDRQPRQCLGRQQARQFGARPTEAAGNRGRDEDQLRQRSRRAEPGRQGAGPGARRPDAGMGRGQPHGVPARRNRSLVLARLWQGDHRSVGGLHRRKRQRLDFQPFERFGGHRRTVWFSPRDLPARHEDRRRHLAVRWLRRRRHADACRRRLRSGRRRLGH